MMETRVNERIPRKCAETGAAGSMHRMKKELVVGRVGQT